ncbi:hypothetical protein EYC08_18675 [Tabrizicola sp. WMC-M-20]|nr:hypothetical protein EYC08_18675 [Tabrizicola sp. WMC-M-20]
MLKAMAYAALLVFTAPTARAAVVDYEFTSGPMTVCFEQICQGFRQWFKDRPIDPPWGDRQYDDNGSIRFLVSIDETILGSPVSNRTINFDSGSWTPEVEATFLNATGIIAGFYPGVSGTRLTLAFGAERELLRLQTH